MLTRRTALSGLAAIASASLLQATAARAAGDDHVAYSDAEWRARLTPEQYADPAQGRHRAAFHQSASA